MVSLSDLTKPVVISTKVLAPPKEHEVKYSDGGANASPPPTVELRVCSELTEYAAPVDYFSSGGKLKTVQGFRGEPLVFAIGNGDKLNCLVHEAGISQGWTLHNISPPDAKVIAFDISVTTADDRGRNLKAGIFLAAASQKSDGLSQLHTAFIPASVLKSSPGPDMHGPWDQAKIPWLPVADPKGGKAVTSLLTGSVKGRKPDQSATIVWAGTKQEGLKAATYYAIDVTPNTVDPWIPFSPDSDADQILDVQPASIEAEDGLFVFAQKADRTECKIYSMMPETLDKTNSKSTLPGDLGKVNAIYSSRNPWNYTDLVFACELGVGFVNWQKPLSKPQEVVGLPRISFREVVCSEKVNPDNKLETCITMFAVSNHNDLYYIEGSRKWKVDGSISLASSGLPIRQNVSRVSCQYNAAMNSSELIYTGTGANEIKHLLRDPHTTCWSESSILFAAPKILNKYHAYVTTISLRCTDGGNVGKDFPVKIKSESMIVLVNDRSYALSTSAREVRTDVQGQLVVVSQASASLEATEDLNLRAPTYTIEIFREGISHTADIHAGQRVIEGFSNMQSAEKLANARSTTGEAIFENGALQNRQEDFEQSASLLKELPSMLNKVSSQPSDQPSASPSELGKEVILGSKQHSTAERSTAVHLSNMQSEENSVSKFVGDALEWIKGAVKKAFKVAFKIVLGGIKLLLTIAGKVISFVVDAVGPLIHAVGTFLKDKLGLDFGKLFKMLGLIFDPEKTKQNQDILKKTIKTVLTLPGELVRSNSQNLNDFFDLIEAGLKPYLGDNTKLQNSEDPKSTLKNSPLAWLFDNPVVKILNKLNPLGIILEAFTEEFSASGLGDDFQVPKLAQYLSPLATTLWDGFQAVIADFMEFIKGLWSKISDSVSDPSQALEKLKAALQEAFWFIFNTVKTLVKTAWQAVGDFMDAVVHFIEAEWKFPLITSLFEWYAEPQHFTLMNVATFVLARLLGIVLGDDNVARYIDPGDTINDLSAVAKNRDIFAVSLKPMMSMQITTPPQPVSHLMRDTVDHNSTNELKMSTFANRAPVAKMAVTNRSAAASTKTKEKESQHSLSKEAKARMHKYEKWSKCITAFVSCFKFATVCLETTHLFAEAGLAAPHAHGGDDGPDMALPILTVVTTSAALLGSVGHLCNWLAARAYSDELKQHLDHNFVPICIGVSVGLAGNLLAVGASGVSYWSIKKGGNGTGAAALSGLFMCIATYGETTGVHLFPAFRSDENTMVDILLGIMECVGTTGALVALGAARAHEPESMAIGLGVDGLCTFVSTLTGIVLVTTDPGEEGH